MDFHHEYSFSGLAMGSIMEKVVPLIISGGSGSRLWPLSREAHPKTFIKLPDGQSLLQKTFTRALCLPQVEEVSVVTREELFYQTKYDLDAHECKTNTLYILEPEGRNTAPAIAITALELAKRYDKKSIMAVLPADHLIPDYAAFAFYARKAIALAQQGFLVTLGLKPSRAETGYGYLEIESHKAFLLQDNGYRVSRFIEKPSSDIAEAYLQSGKHYWNAGMFFFSIETLLAEMERHCMDLLDFTKKCFADSVTNKKQNALRLDANTFSRVPNISIDYALMEKSNQVATVICDFVWNDIGSWNSLSELLKPDENGNKIIGEGVTHDTTNCYLQSSNRVIGTIGVDGLVIVDTADALLVAKRDRVQDVKQLVQLLKNDDNEVIKNHKKVHRPWGHYTVISESENFKIKFINVSPGGALSLQMHNHRSEHWIVLNGTALVTNGDQKFLINTNESTFIPAGHKHRLENPGTIDLVIVEVQCGQYLGEDDIVRFADKYERVLDPV